MVDKNVHVTNVVPGPVRTPVAENSITQTGSRLNRKDPIIEAGMTVKRWECVRTYTYVYTIEPL